MHPESKNIRLLITGRRGFVVSNLLEYLRKHGGYHVTGTSRNADDLRHLESEDLTILSNDEVYTRWDSYDAYIHLAGKVHDVHDKNNDAAYFRANYDATRALRSEEHTSELQSRGHLVCRLLLEQNNESN